MGSKVKVMYRSNSSVLRWQLMNEANLKDLIGATGLVILLELDSNCRFFGQCDLETQWMTSKNNRAPLLYYVKHCASFQSLELQSGKAQFGSKLVIFLSCVTSKFDGWPWKTIGHLFYTMSSFVHLFKDNLGQNQRFFCPMWPWNLTDDLKKTIGTFSMLLQTLCIIS